MYDAQVLSPVMSTNSVPLVGQSDVSSMTKQSSKLTQEEHVVRRGETSTMLQQKSETSSKNHQYQSEARMTSSGKTMFIPCLEDKYDEGNVGTAIPMDNMSLVSSDGQGAEPKYCFLTQQS